jgi:hypothetical protein
MTRENRVVVLFILIWVLAIIMSFVLLVNKSHSWCVLNMTDDKQECPRGYIAVDVLSLSRGRVVFYFFESRKSEILKDFEVSDMKEINGKCYRRIDNPSTAVWAIDVYMDEKE